VTTKRFYFQDSLGNTTHLSDEAGNLLERYTYSAFGLPTFYTPGGVVTLGNVSTQGTRHLFQGQLWTQETGLNDYRNRVEHPIMGVFLQPDPIGFEGDAANLYRFCGNNAVNRIDPDGLYWESLPPQYPRNFDRINAIQGWSKRSNGYTSRPVFSAIATIVPAGEGYAIKYHDVNIKSQSSVRTHQRPSLWSQNERQLIPEDIARTTFHEGRQRRIDRSLYKQWHKNGIFKEMIEGKETYSDRDRAREGLQENTNSARNTFENARREQGRKLQQQDGPMQQNHFVPLGMIGVDSAPSAAAIDKAHQATGVPSLGAESVNYVNGKL